MNELKALEFIRSLGFSGTLGAGLLALFYLLSPDLFSDKVSLTSMLLIGALAGSGLYGLAANVLSPPVKYMGYYFKLVQLALIRPIVGKERFRQLVEALALSAVLGPGRVAIAPGKMVPRALQKKTRDLEKKGLQLAGKMGTSRPFEVRDPNRKIDASGFGKLATAGPLEGREKDREATSEVATHERGAIHDEDKSALDTSSSDVPQKQPELQRQ